jgi:hypothetical protein
VDLGLLGRNLEEFWSLDSDTPIYEKVLCTSDGECENSHDQIKSCIFR